MVTHPFLEFFYPPPSTSWHLSLSLIVSKYISSICRKPCYDHLGSKKVKNISLNSSVANTGRPIVSKTHRLEESLNDAIVPLKIIKNEVMIFQSVEKHQLQSPKTIVIGHLNFNSLRNKFKAVEEQVQNKVDTFFLSFWNKNRWNISKLKIYNNWL